MVMPVDMKHVREGDGQLSFEHIELELPFGFIGVVVQKAVGCVILQHGRDIEAEVTDSRPISR